MAGPKTVGPLLLVLATAPAWAQTETLSDRVLCGRVLDPTHLAIAGARITAVRNNQTPNLSTVSGQNGEFSLPLEAGTYTVNVVAQGFQDAHQTVTISRTSPDALEFVLQVSAVNNTVTIRSRAGIKWQPSAAALRRSRR